MNKVNKQEVAIDHEGACEDSNCHECNSVWEYSHDDFEIIFEHDYDDLIYFNKSVCGDDGKTYDSMCELERANCLNQKGTSTYTLYQSVIRISPPCLQTHSITFVKPKYHCDK